MLVSQVRRHKFTEPRHLLVSRFGQHNFTDTLITHCPGPGACASAGSSLPSPWISQNIGPVGVAGSVSSNSNIFTVQGSGTDIWYNADQFRYVYQPLQGDGALLTRVDSQSGADAWAKAGIMICELLDPNSPYVFVMVTPGNGLAFQSRMTSG